MKKIIVLTLGILLIGINVYAAGDLIVNGQLGVGTSTPNTKVQVISANEKRTLSVNNEINQDGVVSDDFIVGADYRARLLGSSTGSLYGMSAVMNLMNTADTAQSLIAASFTSQVGISDPDAGGTTSVNETVGFDYNLNRHWDNRRTYNIANSYGIRTKITEGSIFGTPVNVTNHYHQYIVDPGALTTMNISNLVGSWINKQTAGLSSNYGLVLNGDGAIGDYGAALVLGSNQNAFLYGKSDGVYVYDGTAETKISPHDPETGEWIYYSKNVKTGKTVRVDMAKLVKAVEKLTGETFMVESIMEGVE
jgi:hypothetical protein